MFNITLLYFLVFTLLINLPCGYYRANTKKFGVKWFIFIHAPVPFLILARHFLDLELTWMLFAMEFPIYFLGQIVGRKYYARMQGSN